MKLNLKEKNVWGSTLIYPDCEKSLLICELTNKKTLSDYEIRLLQKLGYEIETQKL